MKTKYEKILETQGAEAASEYMRQLSAKVKTRGLANVPKDERSDVGKKGWETRRGKETQIQDS